MRDVPMKENKKYNWLIYIVESIRDGITWKAN